MSLLIAFSGQGFQHEKMFQLIKSSNEGKIWLKHASEVLKKDLLDEKIIATYKDDILYAQFFIVLLSVGTFRLIEQSLDSNILLSGYSLGEVSAFCSSSQLSVEEIVELVKNRADWMQKATLKSTDNQPAGLAVLKGHIDRNGLEELLSEYDCYIAIINEDDHYIVGGIKKQLEKLLAKAKEKGVEKAELLEVNLPSHTPLLQEATSNFFNDLKNFENRLLNYSILNTLTHEEISTSRAIIPILANELSQTLNWKKTLQIAQEYGVSTFLEIGPKTSLKNMALPYFEKAYAMEEFSTLEGIISWINKKI